MRVSTASTGPMPPRAPEAVQFEGGGGTREIEPARQGPALQQPIDEASMEDVARTGGVGHGNAISGAQMEVTAIPGQHTVPAESRCGHGTAVAVLHGAKGLFEIVLAGQADGKIAADNEVVDVLISSSTPG